ncbi:UNKNOWN [Stylonychia lemnae]|uniref:Uncharacterized protein n=1 Tax=Stylonychia lemnae TaxID=5949 RepID=A0A077ZZD2_STYLE|nr:UNKNOWN [Stylonychia lemnae]|eukprot:CDW74947.1 UNKNOWN [Stylonychia lemnae]
MKNCKALLILGLFGISSALSALTYQQWEKFQEPTYLNSRNSDLLVQAKRGMVKGRVIDSQYFNHWPLNAELSVQEMRTNKTITDKRMYFDGMPMNVLANQEAIPQSAVNINGDNGNVHVDNYTQINQNKFSELAEVINNAPNSTINIININDNDDNDVAQQAENEKLFEQINTKMNLLSQLQNMLKDKKAVFALPLVSISKKDSYPHYLYPNYQ